MDSKYNESRQVMKKMPHPRSNLQDSEFRWKCSSPKNVFGETFSQGPQWASAQNSADKSKLMRADAIYKGPGFNLWQ